MSGIEIAGLVLGAFPLLIYALEKNRQGAEGVSDWWRIQRTHKKCHQELSYHQILFEGNVNASFFHSSLMMVSWRLSCPTPLATAGKTPSLRCDYNSDCRRATSCS
jgi:hypothetical protein